MILKLKKKKTEPAPIQPEDNSDYDFDFSIYENEEKDIQITESIHDTKKPRITNLRSKFSPSLMQLENLSAIRSEISKRAMKVAAFSQDINDLWELYGCLNEYWAIIHDIYGTLIIKEIRIFQKLVIKKLLISQRESHVDYDTHLMLLKLRDKIYMLAQRHNLNLEVEKTSRGGFDKAKSGMIE